MSWKPPAAWPAPAVATPEPHDTAKPIIEFGAPAQASGARVVEPPRVFISYRRDDTWSFVDVLNRRLRNDLTSTNVYRDVESNILGEPWRERIESEIGRSDAVMVIVGPHWTGPDDVPIERSRLWQNDDMVRHEVALALKLPNRSATLPILVEVTDLPKPLPDDLESLSERHNVTTTATEIAEPESGSYQKVLVGVWHAKKESEPNGIIVFGGESAKAKAVVAEIVHKLQHQALSDLTEVTQYACNARVLSRRRIRRLGRKYPDAIIVVDEESADSPILAARVEEIRRRKIRNVVVLTVGGTIVFGTGAAVGKGGLSGLSDQLGSALSALEPQRVVGSVSKLFSWQATATVATKAVAVAAVAGPVVVAGLAVANVIDPDPAPEVPLAGDWSVDEFTLDAAEDTEPGAFGPIPGGSISFRPVDESCGGDACVLEAVEGPEFFRGATLTPDDDGSYDVDFPSDEASTIVAMTDGGIFCTEDGADMTHLSDLNFDARLDEATDELNFFVTIDIQPDGTCHGGYLEWSAEPTRSDGG